MEERGLELTIGIGEGVGDRRSLRMCLVYDEENRVWFVVYLFPSFLFCSAAGSGNQVSICTLPPLAPTRRIVHYSVPDVSFNVPNERFFLCLGSDGFL